MSRLTSRRAMDARWPWHQRSVPIGHMNAVCEIFRRTGEAANYGYDVATGGLKDDSTGEYPKMFLLYRGRCRMAPNKDWRARMRAARGITGTLHAARFQVPERDCPPIHAHDILRVVSSPPDQELTHFVFHIRNPLMASNMWVRNLLCDVDVAHPQYLPPPYAGTPVEPAMIPKPFTGCGCGE